MTFVAPISSVDSSAFKQRKGRKYVLAFKTATYVPENMTDFQGLLLRLVD